MVKTLLCEKKGGESLTYIMIITVSVILGVAAISFLNSIEGFHNDTSSDIESQGFTSPSTQIS